MPKKPEALELVPAGVAEDNDKPAPNLRLSQMRRPPPKIIAAIEESKVIRKILEHQVTTQVTLAIGLPLDCLVLQGPQLA